MDDAKFLVGAFGTGAQLHDRESVKVVASTEHGTNFTDGACTFLATERLALEVARPESFVVGSWTVPA
jgi:HK97 family phage major capsid protein